MVANELNRKSRLETYKLLFGEIALLMRADLAILTMCTSTQGASFWPRPSTIFGSSNHEPYDLFCKTGNFIM